MSATRDDDGDRGERVRLTEFWRAAETFSPRPLPRPDASFRVTDAGPAEATAQARLADLRRDAAMAYASITATEDTLRSLADQRVAAERSLRAARQRYQAAAKALDAHGRAKPGLRASLSARFGARQQWRARQGVLDAGLRDCAAIVSTAQRAIAEVQAGFAAAVHARAESAAVLRRLTAECAAAQEAIARGRSDGRA